MVQSPDRRRPELALGEPVTEEFVGDWDLTRWPRLGRWLELLAFRASHYASAHAVLMISSAVGAILVLGLTALSAEIYQDVKNADGLSTLDVPVLDLAVNLRTPTNVAVVQFFTNLGAALELTIITAVIVSIMMVRWRSWTPLILLLIGVSGSLLMTVAGKNLVGARPATRGLRRSALRKLAFLPQRPHVEQHGDRQSCCLPAATPSNLPIRPSPLGRLRRALVRGYGLKQSLPRLPLADRRHRRLDARTRVGRPRHHLAPAVSDRPSRTT